MLLIYLACKISYYAKIIAKLTNGRGTNKKSVIILKENHIYATLESGSVLYYKSYKLLGKKKIKVGCNL